MLLRPRNANWFELLTARDALAPTLRSLAETGRVELQSQSDLSADHLLPALHGAIDEYQRLARRYSSFWPAAASAAAERRLEPDQIANAALKQLRAWAGDADPLIVSLQQLLHEQSELELLQPLLTQPQVVLPNLALFGGPGPILTSRLYRLAPKTGALGIPPAVLAARIDYSEQSFLLAIGPRRSMEALDESLNPLKARRLEIPATLPAEQAAASKQVAARVAQITEQTRQLRPQLADLDRKHGIAAALADLMFIEWLVSQVPEFAKTEHFVWITGWTDARTGAELETPLRRAHVHYLLHFSKPPAEIKAPIMLHNPRWARPFELFARLFGVPGANEADPSVILALLTPLMFGFMFGDMGQGAVLVIVGALLRRKYPATAMLIPGGMAAMAFGALFGSVFARDDILPALWLKPLQQPLTLLGVSLAAGSCIILLGLALDALEYYWEGRARLWWATRAGLVLGYLSVIAGVFDRRALWAIPAGLAWYCIGGVTQAPSHARHPAASLGEGLQTLLQLVVNSISFVRIGAFALAHAGLAAATVALCSGIGARPVAFVAMALGNAVLIVIEVLVIGIQTTRLVLFEFFIRFLRGTGRPFRPLQIPPLTDTPEPSRNSP
jgi:V/A-type H+/Na+-transporting ATPase subunit I